MAESNAEPVDFSALILGFSSAALHYLGLAPALGKGPTINLALAKQNIEIIKMLQDKTKGNLSPEEVKLVQQLLADLQVRWVEASRT